MEPDPYIENILDNAELAEHLLSDNATPQNAELLMSMGRMLALRHDHEISNHDRAIRFMEKAVSLISDKPEPVSDFEAIFLNKRISQEDHDSNRAICLSDFGSTLLRRYELKQKRSRHDLDKSISVTEQAFKIGPAIFFSDRYNCFGLALQYRYELTGDIDDFRRASGMYRSAIRTIAPDHANPALFSINLGDLHWKRFEAVGSMDDIDLAIETYSQIIPSISQDNPSLPDYLDNLSGMLGQRFERTGTIDDIDRAIELGEKAQTLSSRLSEKSKGILSHNLSYRLLQRYDYLGSMEDLDRAIKGFETALSLATDKSMRSNNLGQALCRRFERTRSMETLEKAIALFEFSSSAAADQSNQVMYLTNLGNALESRFNITASLNDIDKAVAMKEQAVTLSSNMNDPELSFALSLNNLGNALQLRFQTTKNLDDINRAIAVKEQAIASTPKDHSKLAGELVNLVAALRIRHSHTKSEEDLNQAIKACEKAASLLTALPSDRIKASLIAAESLRNIDSERTQHHLQTIVQLLPQVIPRRLKRSDRQHNISQFSGLSARAVSISLECGAKPYNALQILELGRGLYSI